MKPSEALDAQLPYWHRKLFLRVVFLLTFCVPAISTPSEATPILNTDNGHYYEFIQGAVTWDAARDAAAASTFLGLTGYLATITSLSEETFVESLLPTTSGRNYFLGGSDAGVEGVWLWLTGPEAGTQFWQGGTSGSAVNGAYEDWERLGGVLRQPDNNGNEDYLSIEVIAGNDSLKGWNDAIGTKNGYIVEYSALPVPEPGSLVLLSSAIGAMVVGALRRRRGSRPPTV